MGATAGTLALVVMLAAAGKGGAVKGELGKLEPVTAMDALGGRISLKLPKGTKNEARQRSIMAAPESSEEEARFVIDAGKERMVVMVWELFALAPEDLAAGVKGDLGSEAASREIASIAVADPKLRAVRARPSQPELYEDAALVDAVYLGLADGSAVYVAAYANPKAFENLAGAQALAGKIVASAAGGKRVLARQAGTRKLGDLTITVPKDVVLAVQQGPDFEVYRLRKLAPLGAPSSATMGVYVGFHPSYMHEQSDETVTPAPVKGTLFGREVEWQSWSTKGGPQTLEVIEPMSREHREMLVHVFVTSADAAALDEMRKIAETLALPK